MRSGYFRLVFKSGEFPIIRAPSVLRYAEGIEKLLQCQKLETKQVVRAQICEKMSHYIKRAEEVQVLIKNTKTTEFAIKKGSGS